MSEQADPLADVLRTVKTTDAVRADVWDAFHDATSPDDFTARLKALPLTDTVKADLWELKSHETPAQFNAAATRIYKTENPGKKQPPKTSWVDTAVSWLPATGATAGGLALSAAGPAGTALGAGIGGMAGRMAERGIQEMRGTAEPVGVMNAVDEAAAGGVKDALGGLVVGGVAKGARLAAPALGRAAEVVGDAAQSHSATKLTSALSGYEILKDLFTGNWTAVGAKALIPVGVNVGGKVLSAGGRALQATASEAAPAAMSAAQRAAQIPLRERLAQIPLQDVGEAWQAAKAVAPAASTLADDVQMVRALKAIDYSQEAAIKIVSGGDKELAQLVKQGYLQTLKQRGAPIPAAALKTSGKVPPDVSALMETPTFKALADALANRQP